MSDSEQEIENNTLTDRISKLNSHLNQINIISRCATVLVSILIWILTCYMLSIFLTPIDYLSWAKILGASLLFMLFAIKLNLIFSPNINLIARRFNLVEKELLFSTQIIAKPFSKLNEIEKLQLQRLSASELKYSQGILIGIKPKFIAALSILIPVLLLANILIADYSKERSKGIIQPSDSSNDTASELLQFTDTIISIIPPGYTGEEKRKLSLLSFGATQGSRIVWALKTAKNIRSLEIRFISNDRSSPVSFDGDSYQYEDIVSESDLYYFQGVDQQGNLVKSETFRIDVAIDELPSISISQPKEQILEFNSEQLATIDVKAYVSDDFGFSKMEWKVTAVKGSGEGVKFRDRSIPVEESFLATNRLVLNKQFDMTSFGLEPGNEFYVRLLVSDNALPSPQVVQSPAIIVRWLEQKEVVENTASMQIKYFQEYFRSQRQIIIDTEKLIEEKSFIESEQFENQSRDIGFSQQDLKQRYGQYLGDEADEQVSVNLSEATTNVESEKDQLKSEESDHEQEAENHHHDHGPQNSDVGVNDGRDDLIEQYLHEHQYDDTVAQSNYDPKYLMRQAVAEMWQAEKHLMLFQPEVALPFEYRAYEFLKRARQADRIYVQRLGFEPPPVSEDRRFEGDVQTVKDKFVTLENQSGKNALQSLIMHFMSLIKASNDSILDDPTDKRRLVGLLMEIQNQLIAQKELELAQILSKQLDGIILASQGCDSCVKSIYDLLAPLQKSDTKRLIINTKPRYFIQKQTSLDSTKDTARKTEE
ncbi:MAG: hypothetical protein HWE27_01260 [Gammaproteobacteria bacterium]|nr:hypothetical protein [Gammaproteobacteria bacterium]